MVRQYNRMKTRIVCSVLTLGILPVGIAGQQPALTPQDSSFHALNRLAYGPRPGDVRRVAADGVMRWIDHQLSPDEIDDHRLAERERQFQILDYDRRDLAAMYTQAQRERRERKLAADTMADKDGASPIAQRGKRLAGEFAELAVVRAALSERQLYEIMVDFWTNHFNVYVAKGADRFLTPDYIEHTIRPRAMGKFADLLIAVARSPAMLFYLDNWESVAPGSVPPATLRVRATPIFGRRLGPFGPMRDPARQDSMRRRAFEGMPKGINENYARELLELHTLGVDGGYTQQDVVEVARAFTGWSFAYPQGDKQFVFRPRAHDDGEKRVLGHVIPAGGGEADGLAVIDIVTCGEVNLSTRFC